MHSQLFDSSNGPGRVVGPVQEEWPRRGGSHVKYRYRTSDHHRVQLHHEIMCQFRWYMLMGLTQFRACVQEADNHSDCGEALELDSKYIIRICCTLLAVIQNREGKSMRCCTTSIAVGATLSRPKKTSFREHSSHLLPGASPCIE